MTACKVPLAADYIRKIQKCGTIGKKQSGEMLTGAGRMERG